MMNDVTVFNIREYLSAKDEAILGEEALQQILSEFSCEKNSDVENFLKERAIEFTRKNQSITYLVFHSEDAELVGYFTLTIKPISVKPDHFRKATVDSCIRYNSRTAVYGWRHGGFFGGRRS